MDLGSTGGRRENIIVEDHYTHILENYTTSIQSLVTPKNKNITTGG